MATIDLNKEADNQENNPYNPDDYESIIETFDNKDTGEYPNLWGKFKPTLYQYQWYEHFTQTDEGGLFLEHLSAVGVCHRRFGKSVGILLCLFLMHMLRNRGLYLHAFPSLTQGRAAIWNGMGKVTRDKADQAIPYLELFPKHLWKKKNNHNMTLELVNGSIYQIVGVRGSDGTANHLRGLNPLGLVGDEFGDWHANVVSEIFSPIFAQNGGFKFLVGTPKGENHFFDEYMFHKEKQEQGSKIHKSWLITVDDSYYNDGSRIISEEYIQELRQKGEDEETIQQEYYCSFKASASGAWYKAAMKIIDEEGRVIPLKYDPMLPTYAAYDIGGDGHAAVIVQFKNGETPYVIDYIEDLNSDLGSGEFVDLVQGKHPYILQQFMPWDMGKGHDLVSRRENRIEALIREKNIQNIVKVERGTDYVKNGVDYGKALIIKGFINSELKKFVNHIRQYKRKYDKTTNKFTDKEVHDKHSHAAAAWRTLALAWHRDEIDFSGKARTYKAKFANLPTSSTFNYN